jgi:hypothetical protein
MADVTIYAPGATVEVLDKPLVWGDPTKLMVGMNCFQPFGFGASSGGVYTYTGNGPFTNGGVDTVVLPDARLAAIKSAGFDFVRMVVDVAALLAAPNDATLDGLIAQLIAGAMRRVNAGLRVIVDMHVLPGNHPVHGWSRNDLIDGPSGPKMTRMKYVVARLAAAMSGPCPPSSVCLELYNEPGRASAYVTSSYLTQIKDYWSAVRAACRFTLIVGGSFNNALDKTPSGDVRDGLTALTASNFDANTGFAFHDYTPPVFCMQGVAGSVYEDMHGLTFPLTDYPGGLAQAKADFTTAANALGHANNINTVVTQTTWFSSLDQAFTKYGTKALLATYLKTVTGWADAAGIPRRRLLNTECGVSFRKADTLGTAGDATDASAAAWLQALRENAQSAGIGCITIHEMQGSDFRLMETSAPWAVNGVIKAALFP